MSVQPHSHRLIPAIPAIRQVHLLPFLFLFFIFTFQLFIIIFALLVLFNIKIPKINESVSYNTVENLICVQNIYDEKR